MGNSNPRSTQEPTQPNLGRKNATTTIHTKENPIFTKKGPDSAQQVGKTIKNLQKLQRRRKNSQQENINVIHSRAFKQNVQNKDNVKKNNKEALITTQNEIKNYKYVKDNDNIKQYFPETRDSVGVVLYVEPLEHYIALEDFIKNPEIIIDTKKTLMKLIITILIQLHANGFYYRNFSNLKNIMILHNSENSSYDVKFTNLKLSLNNDSITEYSDAKLASILNVEFLEPRQELAHILADADLSTFLLSCQRSLNPKIRRIQGIQNISKLDVDSFIDTRIQF